MDHHEFNRASDSEADAAAAAAAASGRRPSDAPVYSALPIEAIGRYFRKYAVFHGRASRSEFWWAVALNAFIFICVGVLVEMIVSVSPVDQGDTFNPSVWVGVPYLLYLVLTIIPSIAVFVRRLHDANLAGWWYLLTFVPVLGVVVAVVFGLLPRNFAGARFDRAFGELPANAS